MTLYHDLADKTAALIADGVLRPGDRLPSVRQTCRTHGIAPVTVTQAYHLLESRGLIEARPKSGYFVRARLGQSLPEPEMTRPVGHSTELEVSDFIFEILDSVKDLAVVPLGSSFPSPWLFPLDKLGHFLAAAARHLDPLATVTNLPPGNDELRRQLSLRYLAQGGYENHLRHLRRTLASQEAALVAAVEAHFPESTRLARPQGGYFLWLELPRKADALLLHRQALAQGISIAPGPIFSAKREFGNCIRLNFGHPLETRQQEAVATLGRLLAAQLHA
jgi:DNA-binding transcriptional MocR family regulator